MLPRGVKRLFRFPFRTREDVRTDVREEFAFHIDMRIEELMRLGVSEESARAQALREFGSLSAGAAACALEGDRLERRRRIAAMIADAAQDARVGLRLLARTPAFTAAAVLTLAIGIGANTAIFSTLDAALLRPLPYPQPDRLVHVFERTENGSPNPSSGGAYLDWRTHSTQFEALTLLNRISLNLRSGGTTERLSGLEASHEFTRVLGITPLRGRGFLPGDDRPGGRNDVVLLTEELWRSRFGADEGLVGSTIVLDEIPRTVVGILPAGAWIFADEAFVVPAVLTPGTPRAERAPHWAVVFGRLKAEASIERAEAELRAIKTRLAAEYPSFKAAWSVGVSPLTELIAGNTRPTLIILLGAVSLVLLIACANVANLLLARTTQRRQELAVRTALGASGGRIVRQVLTESIVLAALGGMAGILLAYWGVAMLRQATADFLPRVLAPQLDLRVLAFALAITAVTGLLFGIFPALRARRADVNEALKIGGRSLSAGGRQRARSALVVAQIALTVVLLTSAGLLLRSLANTMSTAPGFEPSRALAFDLSLPKSTYDSDARALAFSSELLSRLRGLPGVEHAGTGMAVPFTGGGYGEYFRRPGEGDRRDAIVGRMDFVSPGYLEALGTRLLAGRMLTDADNESGGPRVTIVSETTARIFFPDRSPVGELLNVAGNDWRIVGVIGDKVDQRLDLPHRPFAYVPQAFNPTSFSVVVRTSLEPLALVGAIPEEIARIDPGVALANPRALDQAMARSMTQRRLVLSLVAAFAGTALLLACVGLYGVVAYAVFTRHRELSIRMALGAVRRDVVREVLGEGLRPIAIGLVLGVAGAFAAARLLASELYRVEATDPGVLFTTILTVVAVATAACWVPAWRATRVNPIVALRNE
ncbi:MAG TPA: ABC transporter permease [Vicinamibacterales bacterium]